MDHDGKNHTIILFIVFFFIRVQTLRVPPSPGHHYKHLTTIVAFNRNVSARTSVIMSLDILKLK